MVRAPLRRGSGSPSRTLTAALAAVALVACSGGSADSGQNVDPAVDETPIRPGPNDRVALEVVAGQTPANSYWNFSGLHGGEGHLRVPLGAEVEIDFRNDDPAMSHSIGVTRWTDPFPADFAPIQPAFPGAMIPGAGSSEGATPPEGRSGFRFRASEEGDFAIVCFVPGHAAVGMYIRVTVVDGLEEASFER